LGHPNETVSGFKQDTHHKSPVCGKVCGVISVIYLDHTPILEECMIRLDLRIDTKQDMRLNETGVHAQTLLTILGNWGVTTVVIHMKNRHICTFDNYN
jgi:hypothetical protein